MTGRRFGRPSRRATAVAGTSAAVAVAASAAGTAVLLRDGGRRERLRRSARVWRLTARRAAHWAVVRVRGAGADEEARARLEQQFAIRTAEDVARELGNMKGAIMKAGQMMSFIAEGLPPEAQAALATLQAEVPPMAPSLAEQVVEDELGAHPEKLFLDWDPVPVAAASIGQVHRAVMRDGREVAVKVQYPGVDVAIKSDLDNVELLYGLIASALQRNLDVKGVVDELRARMGDELDYRIEAAHQTEFAERYATHPFIRVPMVVPEMSAQRVLTSEWVDGLTWPEFEASATEAERQRAGEVLFRFAEGSIWHHGVFNGDPHPGNYRFHPAEGAITFLDFGLVKRWTPGELESLSPVLDAVIDGDPQRMLAAAETARFLPPGHGLDAQHVFEYASAPYLPYLQEDFTFTRQFVGDTLGKVLDLTGPYRDVMTTLNIPASYVILDRVVWGVTALLGRLRARGPWRAMLAEYRKGGPPATELGRIEAEWRAETPELQAVAR
jgi:predicted unusual protein kinase regulating ubiquinone biosynthesis (AarF/ABC1/UbiB family)